MHLTWGCARGDEGEGERMDGWGEVECIECKGSLKMNKVRNRSLFHL